MGATIVSPFITPDDRRALGECIAGARTLPVCCQRQWRVCFYAEEFQTLAYLEEWPAASLN